MNIELRVLVLLDDLKNNISDTSTTKILKLSFSQERA